LPAMKSRSGSEKRFLLPTIISGTPPARVEISASTGKCFSSRTDFPKGDPENPLDDEELISRFCGLVKHSWSEEKVETLLQAVLSLEGLEDAANLFHWHEMKPAHSTMHLFQERIKVPILFQVEGEAIQRSIQAATGETVQPLQSLFISQLAQ
jgi:hypothetical protein